MGQCRTLDAEVTIGCYCGDYSSCDNTIPTSLFIWNTCVCGAGGQAAPVSPQSATTREPLHEYLLPLQCLWQQEDS